MNRSFLSIAVAGIFATSVNGADTNWINGSGSWHSPTKWTAGVPTASSNAVFNLFGSTNAVTLTGTGEVLSGRLIHQRGKVFFSGSIATPMTFLYNNAFAASLSVGVLTGETATMSLSGAIPLTAKSVDIATIAQSTGIINLGASPGLLAVDNGLRIGVVGNGYLYAAGSTIDTNTLVLGVTSTGFGFLSGSTSSGTPSGISHPIRISGQCTIGHFGSGEVRTSLGTMNCGALMLGQNTNSSGMLVAAGPVNVSGSTTIGYKGTGVLELSSTLTAQGGVMMAFDDGNEPSFPPQSPSLAIVTLNGGSIIAGGEVVLGKFGPAFIEMRAGASIESSQRIQMNGPALSDPIAIKLPAIPSAAPCFAAPTINGVRATLSMESLPTVGSVWHIARVFSGALPVCTISTDPGAGNEWRLISCARDLFLVLVPIAEPDPDVCAIDPVAVVVTDSVANPERGFATGGIAIGDGWYAVGCPGVGGGVDVYRNVNGQWILDATLVSPVKGKTLGAVVVADGNRLVTRTSDSSGVFSFLRVNGAWELEQAFEFEAVSVATSTRTLALDGTTLVVGEPFADADSLTDVGLVRVYSFGSSQWSLSATLVPDVSSTNLQFGKVVSCSGDRIAVGFRTFHRVGSTGETFWEFESFVDTGSVVSDVALSGEDLVFGVGALFWRIQDGVWNLSGIGGLGSSGTAIAGSLGFDGKTAAFVREIAAVGSVVTYSLDSSGTWPVWRMGQIITTPTSTEPLRQIAVADPLICVARTASVLVYGELPPSSCRPDFDGNGEVGGADLSFVLSAWGASPLGDLTGDGVTDGADLSYILSAWGPCP